MFVDFFFELRRRKVPVSTLEWLTLMQALALGLHESSLDGFYEVARSICVKHINHYDAFDQAFLSVFRGIESEAFDLSDELAQWLSNPLNRKQLSDAERKLLESLDLEELRRLFEERLKEQKERHDGGNRWIGTGGTSPFGSHGQHPSGIRIGEGGGRSAMQVASERRFREYRSDLTLDVRGIDLALRMLRELGREGAPEELDLEASIDQTAKNAGDIELVFRAPTRNRAKVLLLMDVGGSMDPFTEMVSRLLTAASRTGRFARFRALYFHNCIYDQVYEDARFLQPIPLAELFGSSDRDEMLLVVGDALMHPAELLAPNGASWYFQRNPRPGIEYLRDVARHFPRSIWLNPEHQSYWNQPTPRLIRELFPMFPLTLDGLEQAVRRLIRGQAA